MKPEQCATGMDLEKAQADGKITVEDADTIKAFAEFLENPSSRCIVCLNDEPAVKYWRDHKRLGRVFVCDVCAPVRNPRVVHHDPAAE